MNTYSINQRLLAIIGNVFRAYSVLLFLPHNGKEGGHLGAWWCPSRKFSVGLEIEPGKGYVGFVMRHQTSLSVPATDIRVSSFPYYGEDFPGIKSFLGIPLHGGGVLAIDSLSPDAFTEEDQKLLNLFAQILPQIQIAVESGRQVAEITNYFHAMESLGALRASYTSWPDYLRNSLEIIGNASGFEYISFSSRPDDAQTYHVEGENVPLLIDKGSVELSVQAGIVGWVLRNGESVFNDGSSHSQSTALYGKISGVPEFVATVCIPIIVDKSPSACIALASRTPAIITSEFKTFIRMAADDMAQLLERINLRHKYKNLLSKMNRQ